MDLTAIKAALPDHDVRPVAMSDVPVLYDLLETMTTQALGHSDANEAEIRDDLTGPHFDLQTDTFIALRPDGGATAYGQGHDEHNGSGWIDVYVDPTLDQATYRAVADAAIAACTTRIVQSAKQRGASSVKLTSNLYESEMPMRFAYERAGLSVETVYWRMEVLFSDDAAIPAPSLSSDVEIRAVDPDDDAVMATAYGLYRETFSDHHGVGDTDTSLVDYATNWRTAESYDRSAWWFAFDGNEPVGLLLGDNRRLEQGFGYVRALGVRNPMRGRGIARALLLTAFAHWRAAGRIGVQLGVDTGNVTGATRLYESVGLRSRDSAIAMGRDVSV